MADVLTITKSKQYISIETLPPIASIPSDALQFFHDPEANKRSPAPHILLAKKHALSGAAAILTSAHERLSASLTTCDLSQASASSMQQSQSARARNSQWQLAALQLMRRHWRIRLVDENVVVGDLSYTAASGLGPNAGLIEVRRVQSSSPTDCIELVLPRELHGEAELELCLFEEANADALQQYMFARNSAARTPDCRAELKELSEITTVRFNHKLVSSGLMSDPQLPPWHLALQRAQQNLFLRELFTQLTREAPLLSSAYNLIIRENQLLCNLFDDLFLRISFHHSRIYPENRSSRSALVGGPEVQSGSASAASRADLQCTPSGPSGGAFVSVVRSHAASLLHSLALQALRDVHHSRLHLLGHTLGQVCNGNPLASGGAGTSAPRGGQMGNGNQLGVLGTRYSGVPSEPLRLGFYAPALPRVPPPPATAVAASVPVSGSAPTVELAQNVLLLGYLLHAASFIAAHDLCARLNWA